MSDIKSTIAELTAGLVETRHYLHAHPELSGQEAATAAYIAARLTEIGVDSMRTSVGGHGIVAELRGSCEGPTVALRGDMDALPIQEQNEIGYCSTKPGVMHACGHDGHTTILLGAVQTLARHRDRFTGVRRFLFQPAEENVSGALKMCTDGAMDGVDAVFGLHGWSNLEVGQIGILAGPMMAGVDDFDITILGRGSHAAYPHLAIDPTAIGAQIVGALQLLVSRETDPFEQAVVSVTQFHSGTTYNVIPETAQLSGTIRTLSAAMRERLPRRLREVAEGVCAAAGARCHVTFIKGSPPVINDVAATEFVGRVGVKTLGHGGVVSLTNASMGAEDFAVYLGYAPGSFFRLGLGDVPNLHTPTFNFADAAIPVGVEMMCAIATEAALPLS